MSPALTLIEGLRQWPVSSGPWLKPKFEPVGLNRTSECLHDLSQVRQRIESFMAGGAARNVKGWIETADRTLLVMPGKHSAIDSPVLNAELVEPAAGRSLHVRQMDGRWLLLEMAVAAADDQPLLADRISMVCAAPDVGNLYYQRFWQAQDDGQLLLIAARLANIAHHPDEA